MRVGDTVIITQGPLNKIGKIGIISIIASNGAFIKFPNGNATAVKFNHLEKLYKCCQCNKFKRDYEMNPMSQNIINSSPAKLNHDICKICNEKIKKEFTKEIKNMIKSIKGD